MYIAGRNHALFSSPEAIHNGNSRVQASLVTARPQKALGNRTGRPFALGPGHVDGLQPPQASHLQFRRTNREREAAQPGLYLKSQAAYGGHRGYSEQATEHEPAVSHHQTNFLPLCFLPSALRRYKVYSPHLDAEAPERESRVRHACLQLSRAAAAALASQGCRIALQAVQCLYRSQVASHCGHGLHHTRGQHIVDRLPPCSQQSPSDITVSILQGTVAWMMIHKRIIKRVRLDAGCQAPERVCTFWVRL